MQANNESDSTSEISESTPPIQENNPPPQEWQQQQQPQQQQQWIAAPAAMQYPTAAMMMQQQQMMMFPHQYVPYYQGIYQHYHPQLHQHGYYQQQRRQQNKPLDRGSGDHMKTLWIGDLLHWMNKTYLRSCFSHTYEVSSVKVICKKLTYEPARYGFVEFRSRAVAEEVLQKYNGSIMPNSDQPFRLNWAGEKRAIIDLFVGDLSSDVTGDLLYETFSSRYPSVKAAKVVTDPNTGRSKGHGYVRFGDENERSRALTEMNGALCFNTQMRVGIAKRKRASAQQQHSSQGGHGANDSIAHGSQSEGESINSTIYVGGIDSDVTNEYLRQSFSQIGEVVSVRIRVGRGFAFVQFADRKSAEDAIESLDGTIIGKNTVRLSWARSPKKQV